MENQYGIGIKNRYELFCNEDDDPFEILKQQEAEIEKRKTEKAPKDKHKHGVGKAPKQPPNIGSNTKKESESTQKSANTDSGRFRPKPVPEKGARFGGGRLNNDTRDLEERNRRNREDQSGNSAPSDARGERRDGELRRGRGGPRGGRGRGGMFGRGRGGGSGFDGRGKREFDRQSGSDKSDFGFSGVKPVEKREGGGAHNWGTVKDDLEIQLNAEGDYNTEGGERSGDEVIAENAELKGEEEPASQETVKEPEEREMTLDEWKQQQQVKRSVPKYNLRKPGEGEDKNQWNKLYLLKKKAEEEDEEEEEEDLDDEDYVRRGRQKQRVDIEINFGDPPGGRGRGRGRGRGVGLGRGGRGNNRGGRGGGGGGGGGERGGSDNAPPPSFAVQPKAGTSPQQTAPKVDDWNDFPSLAMN